jgi:uncharacterized membrane protein YGL010W
MIGFLISVLELFGIVFLRFRPLPRIWCVWLVGVNLGCLFFLTHAEGQVVLGVTVLAVVAQSLVYMRLGFTRVLGTAHILWLPMFAWMAFRLDAIRADPALSYWLAVLVATNAVSFVIDSSDVFRFVTGERTPHYHWHRPVS